MEFMIKAIIAVIVFAFMVLLIGTYLSPDDLRGCDISLKGKESSNLAVEIQMHEQTKRLSYIRMVGLIY